MSEMLTIRCHTVEFAPRSKRQRREAKKWHRCVLCEHRTEIAEDCGALVMIVLSAPAVMAVWEADTGILIHDCRHIRVLQEAESPKVKWSSSNTTITSPWLLKYIGSP